MINNDRIVPIQKIDLLSMYGTILNFGALATQSDAPTVLAANTIEGDFSIEDDGIYIANQPVKTIDFTSGVSGVVYFVAAYNYAGMTVDGSAVAPTGAVNPDGATLYQATISSGSITIKTVTPELSE